AARMWPTVSNDLRPATHVLLHLVDDMGHLADVPEPLHAALRVALLQPGLLASHGLDEPMLDALHEGGDFGRRHEAMEGAIGLEALGGEPVRRVIRIVLHFFQRGSL